MKTNSDNTVFTLWLLASEFCWEGAWVLQNFSTYITWLLGEGNSTPLCREPASTTPVLLPGKSHGWRNLVGYSPWGRYESDTTERLHFHFSLSCIREGNGNPLQCSCLENPRDGGAWWAAVYGVAQSRTQLKQLSSSSSNLITVFSLTSFLIIKSFPQLYCIFIHGARWESIFYINTLLSLYCITY